MREIRQSGSEGGVAQANALLLPLSQGIGALNPRDALGVVPAGSRRLLRNRLPPEGPGTAPRLS